MILHIPTARPPKASRKTINPKVIVRVREYLEQFAHDVPVDIVERVAHDVFLGRFGYNVTEGKHLAPALIAQIQQEQREAQAVPMPPPCKPVERPVVPTHETRVVSHHRTREQKLANRRRKAKQIGEHNEERFHTLMLGLTRMLTVSLPSIVQAALASRSDRFDPLGGTVDSRDHDGDDVSLEVTVARPGATKLLIYDVKSCERKADAFNSSIVRYGARQQAASLKRAIVVNVHRSNWAIVREVLEDLDRVGLVPAKYHQQILDQFAE